MPFVDRNSQAPCVAQTAEAIEVWLRANARKDTDVVVRYIVGGRIRYQSARVVGVNAETIRVAVRKPNGHYQQLRGAFFFTGRSCWIPGLLIHLLIPTPDVLSACGSGDEECER